MTRLEQTVLGLDLALASWAANGSALVSFEVGGRWRHVRTRAVPWPAAEPVNATNLARAIDEFARSWGIGAIAIDGPHAWRDPSRRASEGVARLCEREARTPGKTGAPGVVFPKNYTTWVNLSIEVFARLLAKPGVALADDPQARAVTPPAGGYLLLECFPTATWRSLELTPLPGHANAPPDVVARHARELSKKLGLPKEALTDEHDELQALVAALPAVALLGGPGEPIARGLPSRDVRGIRCEGLIWDVRAT